MSEKPTLPSIQVMLNGLPDMPPTTAGGKGGLGHRRHCSDINGTRLGLENLSLSTPKPIEPGHPSSTDTSLKPFHPAHLYQYSYSHPRSARNLHSRSYSDYTHPYLTSPPPTLPSIPSGLLAPASHLQHRRAISTSTAESMMRSSSPAPTSPQRHPGYSYAHTSSSQPTPTLHTSLSSTTTTSAPHSPTLSQCPSSLDEPLYHSTDDDADDQHHAPSPLDPHTTQSTSTIDSHDDTDARASANPNRYKCFYCQKGFSRPSSLRIHTYSHTGEKPFECPEPGCSRKFSVQSNMRRHLRVHRNGRHLKLKRSPPCIKPLAAKPSWMPAL
ncbi:hypothetical protein DM01DRAFT_1330744 [Hesseltinella vesiculosa]|uniref:C2H2-type domain-containing protein n=1 Tax=Hesseltinella vesiculosa TaxID=101127 RepID=A0A1X2GYA0_9FUNG|nr:hypothetical protein DM01DRAFT_1330744 [Hesseltinella vesiculosa]